MGKARYIHFFIKNSWHVMMYRFFHKKKSVTRFLKKKNITLAYSNDCLKKWIESGKPFSAIRFGAVELSCVNNYEKICLGWKKEYKPSVVYSIKNGAGVFPTTQDGLTAYSLEAIHAFQKATILGISGLHMEDYFYLQYARQCEVAQYEAFEPLRGNWIQALKGKKVLVISPFEKDIQNQFLRMDLLFKEGVVPSFQLITYAPVVTFAKAEDDRFATFSEALKKMEEDIAQIDFDIALIGAGAYGSPLCSFIGDELQKQAIQTGGATPTLFGILGKRWENREHVMQHVNEYWIRPSFFPEGYKEVEGGCYW